MSGLSNSQYFLVFDTIKNPKKAIRKVYELETIKFNLGLTGKRLTKAIILKTCEGRV